MSNMVQYGMWPNCSNNCKFCLLKNKKYLTKLQMLDMIHSVINNINYIDWKNEFSSGISLLGGELYFVTDVDVQSSFLNLIDVIINKILKVSTNPNCKYSTVTNGLYNPAFLYKVVDKIINEVGIEKVDINFSYDLNYRYRSIDDSKLVIKNINDFHNKYDYEVNVQMILTQYVIDLWKLGKFDVGDFIESNIPGNILTFLYPHPIHGGVKLPLFKFNRKDFLRFINYLKDDHSREYGNFYYSVLNSGLFKYTGLVDRYYNADITQQPKLWDGKEELTSCGHSILYRCYEDCDNCMLCDLIEVGI